MRLGNGDSSPMKRGLLAGRNSRAVNSQWESEFRRRMDDFSSNRSCDLTPVSIKIRIESGCFHREHSPEAFNVIDNYFANADLSDLHYQIEEHESGPEILVYLAVAAAGLGFAKSLVDLITAIIKARSEGIKRGDGPSEPLVLIVRGHSREGEYFEEMILRIPSDQTITPEQIENALSTQKKLLRQSRKR